MTMTRAAAAILCFLLAAGPGSAQLRQALAPYEVVRGWPQLPEGRILGQATGVDVDTRGNVFVFHRGRREWLGLVGSEMEVFEGARHLRSWGANLFLMPHGLTIDQQDNVWVTDVLLHQVLKFSPSGELLLTVGQARVAGADRLHFDQPTDVAVLPDGSFYVADG